MFENFATTPLEKSRWGMKSNNHLAELWFNLENQINLKLWRAEAREYTHCLKGRNGVSCNQTAAVAALAMNSFAPCNQITQIFIWIQPMASHWDWETQLCIGVELHGWSNSAAINWTKQPGILRWAKPGSKADAVCALALATADLLWECKQNQLSKHLLQGKHFFGLGGYQQHQNLE